MSKNPENSTLAALIDLLDEPDETAYGMIEEQILLQGMDAIAPLEKSLENSFNSLVHERIRSIVRELNRQKLHAEMLNWINVGSSDLLTGFMLVTKTVDPSLDDKETIIRIEQLKIDIWIELNDNLTALENIKVLNHILFEIHHFGGDKTNVAVPQKSLINSMLETKKGSPLALGMLFIILAQKLGLPVFGVDLPQHFILVYLAGNNIENPGEDDVLFYINPFNNGAVFTRREIELFIGQAKIPTDRSFFEPCSNLVIIRRLISELVFSYNQSQDHGKIADLGSLLTAFE